MVCFFPLRPHAVCTFWRIFFVAAHSSVLLATTSLTGLFFLFTTLRSMSIAIAVEPFNDVGVLSDPVCSPEHIYFP